MLQEQKTAKDEVNTKKHVPGLCQSGAKFPIVFFFFQCLTETLWYLWLDSFENNINKEEKEEHYAFLISKDLILISHTKQSLLMTKMYNTWHSLRRNHVQQKVSWSGLKAKNEKKNHPQFM